MTQWETTDFFQFALIGHGELFITARAPDKELHHHNFLSVA